MKNTIHKKDNLVGKCNSVLEAVDLLESNGYYPWNDMLVVSDVDDRFNLEFAKKHNISLENRKVHRDTYYHIPEIRVVRVKIGRVLHFWLYNSDNNTQTYFKYSEAKKNPTMEWMGKWKVDPSKCVLYRDSLIKDAERVKRDIGYTEGRIEKANKEIEELKARIASEQEKLMEQKADLEQRNKVIEDTPILEDKRKGVNRIVRVSGYHYKTTLNLKVGDKVELPTAEWLLDVKPPTWTGVVEEINCKSYHGQCVSVIRKVK